MSPTVPQTCGRAALTLALLGVLFQATLLPWHSAARFASRTLDAELAAGLKIICHGSAGAGPTEAPSRKAPPLPADPQSLCPICLGLAGIHLAMPVLGWHSLISGSAGHVSSVDSYVLPAGVCLPAPRSRGPPLH